MVRSARALDRLPGGAGPGGLSPRSRSRRGGRDLSVFVDLVRACLDLLAPTNCVLCGSWPGVTPFCGRGRVVPGLRAWDDVPLCRACAGRLGPPRRRVFATEHGPLPVHAACATGPEAAGIIHAWKYHGRRGLAWPLAARVALAAAPVLGADPALVPVPLHPRRRRSRGFNQAELLARLVAHCCDLPVHTGLLRRVRATGQQAKLNDARARRANVGDAFRPVAAKLRRVGRPLLLVDDVVTSGATAGAAAAALRAEAGEVVGILAVATAQASSRAVDTP